MERARRFKRATDEVVKLRPIRCITCGKLLGDKYGQFEERVKKGEEPKKVLDDLGLTRYCCRAALLTSVDLMDEIAKFKK